MRPLKDALGWRYYLFVLVTLASFFVTASVVFIRTHRMLKERIFSELQILAKGIDGMLDAFIEGKKGRVLDFCSDGIIKDGLTFYDPDDSDVGELLKQINNHLVKNKRILDPYLEDIMVLNLKGKVVFSTNEALLGKDKSEKDYFLELSRYLRDKNLRPKGLNLIVYASDVYICEDFNFPVFSVAAIVTARQTGLPLGIVVNFYKAEVLDKFIKIGESQLTKTVKAYIINKEGLFLTYPKVFITQGKEAVFKEKVSMDSLIIGQTDDARILGVYKNFQQKKVLGAALLMDINNWIILAERDAREAFSPLYELTRQIIVIGLVSLLGIIGISVFMTNLQKRIGNKTRELETTKAQMYQSGKMAAIGQLASSIVHEINNPLTGVLSNAQLLKMMLAEKNDFRPDEARQILDVMEDSALRGVRVIRSLLDFSRAASSKFQPVSLNEAVDKVIAIVDSEMRPHSILIEKHLQPGLPQVQADIQLIQQAIFDMINNAKYAIEKKHQKEGGLISIKTRYDQAPLGGQAKDVIELSISDNGIGIPKENMDKLFTPFFTTKPIGEGTGLGLSIIYDIITKHRGTIEVESEPGEGTTFKVSLPALKGELLGS